MKAAHIAIVVAAGVACFFIGRSLRGDSVTPAETRDSTTNPAERFKKKPPKRRPVADSWTDIMRLDPPSLEVEHWKALLKAAKLDRQRSGALVRRWAGNDPSACWAYILTMGDGVLPPENLATIAIDIWAENDPDAAIKALAALDPNNKHQRAQLATLVRAAMRKAYLVDIDRAFAEWLPLALETGSMIPNSVQPWMEKYPERACRGLASLPEKYPYRRGVGPASRAWYRTDPDAAVAWVLGLPHDLRKEALDDLGREIAETGDFEELEKLALSVKSMHERQRVASKLRRHLKNKDPALACEWVIENYDGRMMGAEMENIINTTDHKTFPAERYVPYFDRIPEGLGKGEAATTLFQEWIQTDAKAAADWMAKLDPRSMYHIHFDPLRRWAKSKEAHEWLQTAPDSDFMRKILRAAVDQMGNPEKVTDWAATLPGDRQKLVEEQLEKRKK